MKNKLLFASLLAFSLAACNETEKNNAQNEADSTVITVTGNNGDTSLVKIDDDIEASFSALKHFANYSEDFQLLITSLDGVFRGVELGMTKEEVKKLETDMGKLGKETANELNYKASLGEGEVALISYKFKDNKVNGIVAEVRVKEIAAYEALNSELVDYYQTKFGNMQLDNMQEMWKISDTHKITVRDIEKSKTDFYILIEVK
jgi:hypothetical protein